MYIKSIVIDGFKSYAKRTEVNDFDPAFNAVTGLNGSGKSNILDAICFVLGISNLSQVRVGNLQELVYKTGKAGVTKATVSIIFDNRQKSDSPSGCTQFDEITITRQIVIGGKNKYLLNGVNCTNQRIQDLFRSVQLNVNNPHFLIMQGRITKVLNMKPPEILSLLEEAASTNYYEEKRKSTLETIDKKDSKLNEITRVLDQDINPKLAKLRQDRSSYVEYQTITREIDHLKRFIVALQYVELKEVVDMSSERLKSMQLQQKTEDDMIIKYNDDRSENEKEMQHLSNTKDNVLTPEFDELSAKMSEIEKQETLLINSIKRSEDGVKQVNVQIKKLETDYYKQQKMLETGNIGMTKLQSAYDDANSAIESARTEVDLAMKYKQDVNTGLFATESGGDKTASLSEILTAAMNDEAKIKMNLNSLQMKMKHMESARNDLNKQLSRMSKNETAANHERMQSEYSEKVRRIQLQMDSIGYSEEQYCRCRSKASKLQQHNRETEMRLRDTVRMNQRLTLQYRRSQFLDDRKIIGVLAKLFQLTDGRFETALEMAAGGMIYHVIVEDDETAATLIDKNLLEHRYTLLPINTIKSNAIPAREIERIKSNYGGNCEIWSPLELIKFDSRYLECILYAFGQTIIVRDNKIALDIVSKFKIRVVTLDGDIYDPSGTLSGGSKTEPRYIISTASKIRDLEQAIHDGNVEIREISDEIKRFESKGEEWERLRLQMEDLETKLRELESRIIKDDYLQIQSKLSSATNELNNLKSDLNEKQQALNVAREKTKEAEYNLKNAASVKEKAEREAEARLNQAKKELEKCQEHFNGIATKYEELNTDVGSSKEFLQTLNGQIEDARRNLETKQEELLNDNQRVKDHEILVKEIHGKVGQKKKELKEVDIKIGKIRHLIQDIINERDQASLRLVNINNKIETHNRESRDAVKKLDHMEQRHMWIKEERHLFGKSNTQYDFGNNNSRETEQKIEKLEEQQEKLRRKVDMRGMTMLGPTEERYNDLMNKYQQVLQDKTKLQAVIEELDHKKIEVICRAHEQVDKDFDKIFSTLLPGSRARLVPPDGKSITEGLEFRIAFGNVWKESLNELSGGQRSLVALSLILALLRFKPAPLYILDEVDAALDISHTQNIGTLIKEQFGNSQFIIVSLKDGMFNNANVLFKTKFVDGVSTVSRHVNQSRKPMSEKNN